MVSLAGYFVSRDLRGQDFTPEVQANYARFTFDRGFVLLFNHRCNDQRIMIHFYRSEKEVSTEDIKQLAIKLSEEAIFNGMIVSNKSLSAPAKRMIQEIYVHSEKRRKFFIEHFDVKELLINITRHEIVPKHFCVTEEEKVALLKRYHVRKEQLPKILSTDPVARYLGLRPGQLVKVVRTSETAGQHFVYRITINGN